MAKKTTETAEAPAAEAPAAEAPAAEAPAAITPAAQAAEKQARIAELQKEIDELQKPAIVEFPKTLYHAKGGVRTVESRVEQDELGEGWAESPADHPKEA